MAYRTLFDNIPFSNKGHDIVNSSFRENNSWGAICDGVSSSYKQVYGARLANSHISNFFDSQESLVRTISYESLYSEISDQLNKAAVMVGNDRGSINKSIYATTLITAYLQSTKAEFSYCGN